jgi:hypothetical protein
LEVSFKVQCSTIPIIPYPSGGISFIDTLLKIPGGITSALKSIFVKDTETPLKLSTTKVGIGAIPDVEAAINTLSLPTRRILYRKNTHTSFTGNSSEHIHDIFMIPANTIQANDIINIVATSTKTGVNAVYSVRVRINVTPDLVAGPEFFPIAINTTPSTNSVWNKVGREIICRNSKTSQILWNGNNAASNDFAFTAGAASEFNIDFTKNQYVIVTTQANNAADIVFLRGWYIEIIR